MQRKGTTMFWLNIGDSRMFNTSVMLKMEKPVDVLIDAIAVLIGDYPIERKMAANILLGFILTEPFKKILFEEKDIYPTDRNDARVTKWKKDVLSVGRCEKCGSKTQLEAHHIIYWSDYPQGRVDRNNGECLCVECHAKAHSGENAEHLILSKRR